jgi:hypothetical protein
MPRPPVYDAQVNYIKDSLGGYGLYYSAAISGMGLTLPAAPAAGLPFDAPTPEGRGGGDVSGGGSRHRLLPRLLR